MNYPSLKMTLVENEQAVRNGKLGSFCYAEYTEAGETHERMWIKFPIGEAGDTLACNLAPGPPHSPGVWKLHGSREKPTLDRPITLRGRWCGEIKNGRMVGHVKSSDLSTPPVVVATDAVPQLPKLSTAHTKKRGNVK